VLVQLADGEGLPLGGDRGLAGFLLLAQGLGRVGLDLLVLPLPLGPELGDRASFVGVLQELIEVLRRLQVAGGGPYRRVPLVLLPLLGHPVYHWSTSQMMVGSSGSPRGGVASSMVMIRQGQGVLSWSSAASTSGAAKASGANPVASLRASTEASGSAGRSSGGPAGSVGRLGRLGGPLGLPGGLPAGSFLGLGPVPDLA
jgi:hypothetical protein